jgi:hypothetical protein
MYICTEMRLHEMGGSNIPFHTRRFNVINFEN